MRDISAFWRDESGLILSAEAVTLGTVAVLGATAAISTTSEAINQELLDLARAIRSFDQSYSTREYRTDRSWSAGSHYRQEDVAISLKSLELKNDDIDLPASDGRQDAPQAASVDPYGMRRTKSTNRPSRVIQPISCD